MSAVKSIPDLLQRAARRWGPAIAMRHRKNLDRWGILTWSEVAHQTAEIAAGLVDLGLRHGERVAVFAATRAGWTLCDYGILSAGAVTVPVYHTSTTGQLTYIVNNCQARFLVVDNEARLEMAYGALERMRSLEKVIVLDRLALEDRPDAISLVDLSRRGRRFLRRNPHLVERSVEAIRPQDEATYVYTSGATGMPKGCVLTHHNLLSAVQGISTAMGVDDSDVTVLYLPLSHIYGRIGQFLPLQTGVSTAYAQRIDRLEEVLLEVKPTFILGVPLVYERIYRALVQRFRELSPLRRMLFQESLGKGLARIRSSAEPGAESLPVRLLERVSDKAVFTHFRDSFGGRMRFAVSGGAPLHPSIAEFFRVVGIELLEGYGLTETAAAATLGRLEDNRIGSVGHPIPGMRIRIAPGGEVLIRGDSVFREYHGLPADTAAVFDDAGWFRTGDTGWIDSEGRLIITGRVKDLIITSGAKNVAPQYVEAALKMSPWIREAMVFGDRRRYVVALVDLPEPRARSLAKKLGLDGADLETLSHHPKVVERLRQEIDIANRRLAPFEQVRRFAIVPRPLSIGEGTVSHSLKLRRQKVAAQYETLIDSLYAK